MICKIFENNFDFGLEWNENLTQAKIYEKMIHLLKMTNSVSKFVHRIFINLSDIHMYVYNPCVKENNMKEIFYVNV